MSPRERRKLALRNWHVTDPGMPYVRTVTANGHVLQIEEYQSIPNFTALTNRSESFDIRLRTIIKAIDSFYFFFLDFKDLIFISFP